MLFPLSPPAARSLEAWSKSMDEYNGSFAPMKTMEEIMQEATEGREGKEGREEEEGKEGEVGEELGEGKKEKRGEQYTFETEESESKAALDAPASPKPIPRVPCQDSSIIKTQESSAGCRPFSFADLAR